MVKSFTAKLIPFAVFVAWFAVGFLMKGAECWLGNSCYLFPISGVVLGTIVGIGGFFVTGVLCIWWEDRRWWAAEMKRREAEKAHRNGQ
jgi:hypothetical protein